MLTYLIIHKFNCILALDILSDRNLTFKCGHEIRVFVEICHVHRFDGIKLAVFEIFDLIDFTVAAFSKENFGIPVIILTERKLFFFGHQ
jgi:hypothetical protein